MERIRINIYDTMGGVGGRDHLYYLTDFGSLKKKANESVFEFNRIFNNLYNKIPIDIKTSKPTTKVTYVGEFEAYFTILLR